MPRMACSLNETHFQYLMQLVSFADFINEVQHMLTNQRGLFAVWSTKLSRVWISSWQCNIYALDCEVQLSDCFKTAIEWSLLVRWKPRYLWNQVFKVSAKLVYETEQLCLKNSFVWPLICLSARLETSWTLKQGPDSLESANLFNLHSKAAKAISANKEKKIRLSQAEKS